MTSTQSLRYDTCPVWCTADHGSYDGEEDHLHTGADLHVSDDLVVRLCAYVDPDSGNADKPVHLCELRRVDPPRHYNHPHSAGPQASSRTLALTFAAKLLRGAVGRSVRGRNIQPDAGHRRGALVVVEMGATRLT